MKSFKVVAFVTLFGTIYAIGQDGQPPAKVVSYSTSISYAL